MTRTDVDPTSAGDAGRRTRTLRLPSPPLWLLGLIEAVQVLLAGALLVAVPVLAIGLAGGLSAVDVESLATLAARIWLVLHGTPVVLSLEPGAFGGGLDAPDGGWFHLLPMGLTAVPLALAWRAGARVARGAWTRQLWQGMITLVVGYAAGGAGIAVLADDAAFGVQPGLAAAFAALVMGVGSLAGGYSESQSWTRLIGVDLEARVAAFSQKLRWAGSYLWAVVRAGTLAVVAAVGLSALLLAVQIARHWMDVANIYQELDPGVLGVVGLTLVHLGLLPNLVLWTLSYAVGAGFSVGAGTQVAPHAVDVSSLPAVPLLGALPAGVSVPSMLAPALVVLAGIVAGWWLMREGENHLDDWFALRIDWRPASLILSSLVLALLTGLTAGLILLGPLWLSRLSLGVGRMTEIGPPALLAAGLVAAWVAAGTLLGYLVSPVLHRLAPDAATGRQRVRRRREARREKHEERDRRKIEKQVARREAKRATTQARRAKKRPDGGGDEESFGSDGAR